MVGSVVSYSRDLIKGPLASWEIRREEAAAAMAAPLRQKDWQVTIEFVPFDSEESRECAYAFWCTSYIESLPVDTSAAPGRHKRKDRQIGVNRKGRQ